MSNNDKLINTILNNQEQLENIVEKLLNITGQLALEIKSIKEHIGINNPIN